MKHFTDSTKIPGLIAVMIAVLMIVTVFAPFSIIAAVKTSISNTGDEHDDRPDDAGSVGGDNSVSVTEISAEARAWANANGFNLSAFEDYTAPAPHAPAASDIAAFEGWMNGGSNPRNQVIKQMQSIAGETIANELWNYCNTIWKGWMHTANVGSVVSRASGLKNVGAMQEGMFAGFFGSLIASGNNPGDSYANANLLIVDGFVVSSDGVTFRLHNISDGGIAYEMPAPKPTAVSLEALPAGLLSFTSYLPMETHKATAEAIKLLSEYAALARVKEPENADRDIYNAAALYVNDNFGEYYGQCPGPTVVKGITALGIPLDAITEDTVGSSVGEREFVASFFGVDNAAAKLWKLGFLPSFDGTTYRLHSGKDGTVVFSATAQELADAISSIDGSTKPNVWLYIGLGLIAVIVIGSAVYFLNRNKRKQLSR